jgi:hypothetical protein
MHYRIFGTSVFCGFIPEMITAMSSGMDPYPEPSVQKKDIKDDQRGLPL